MAFSASASAEQEVNERQVIIFDNIVTNIGNHYQAAASVFTCPVNGLYQISVSPTSSDCETRCNVMRENDVIASTRAEEDGYNQSGVTVFVECQAGQRIWVEGRNDGDCMYGSSVIPYSMFSGLLVQAQM